MVSLDRLRNLAGKAIIAILWINVALIMIREAIADAPADMVAVIGAFAIAIPATFTWYRDPIGPTTRLVTSTAHAASVALLVYAFRGSPLQIDIHMYFFASLAICATWIDWKAISVYSGFVALHHLMLYFVMPFAVFPGESDFSRVVLHAVVLIAQTAVLIPLTHSLTRAFETADTSIQQANDAQGRAENAARQIEEATALADEERSAHEAERNHEAAVVKAAVDSVGAALKELAAGNVTYRIRNELQGDLDNLRTLYNVSAESLEHLIRQVGGVISTVNNGTRQVSESNHHLSARSERQAATIDDTARAVSEMTRAVGSTAKLAQEVGGLAVKARDGARQSGKIVGDAVEAMGQIATSSSQVTNIISVIDEIAFQTNLLALNAGVEAARAGDSGKGFAVVAQEVRELAQRSAHAAKEIKGLINKSGDQVRVGVELVNSAGDALQTIIEEVNAVSTSVDRIVSNSTEQAQGLASIDHAISEFGRDSQQNAALVEESSAAMASLSNEANALDSMMQRFSSASPRVPRSRAA